MKSVKQSFHGTGDSICVPMYAKQVFVTEFHSQIVLLYFETESHCFPQAGLELAAVFLP